MSSKKKPYSNKYNPWKGWRGKSSDYPGAKEKVIPINIKIKIIKKK